MKLHKSVYRVIFLLFILVQTFFPSVELSVLISGTLSLVLLMVEPLKFSRSLSILISYLLAILVFGSLSSLFYDYELFDRLRDVVHFLKPVLLCFLAYLLIIRIDNTRYVLRLIVFLGVFLAIKHFITLAFADLPDEFRIDRVRAKAGASNFIELVSLIILLAFNKSTRIIGPQTRRLILLILFASFVLYFSRIMILGLVIFTLSIYGFTKLTRRAFEYSLIVLTLFGLFFLYLNSVEIKQDQEGLAKLFYKIKISPGEVFAAPSSYDPSNHKEIFKHWRGYEAKMAFNQMDGNIWHYIKGKGFGAMVDLGFKAPVGGDDGLRYIPHLHNGYIYLFYKVGIIGLLMYLVLVYNIYKQVYLKTYSLKENVLRRIISGFGVYYFASSLVITGLYNLAEISMFCLGMFIALADIEVKNSKLKING